MLGLFSRGTRDLLILRMRIAACGCTLVIPLTFKGENTWPTIAWSSFRTIFRNTLELPSARLWIFLAALVLTCIWFM